MFTRNELKQALADVGMKPENTVMVHAAASALGEVEGGTAGILQLLREFFADEGLLAMPAMTYTLMHNWDPESTRCMKCSVPEKYCFARGLASNAVRRFHAGMPTCVGRLSNLFLGLPGVKRSLSATSSVAALGRDAAEFTAGHEACESGCSAGSPWWKLVERKGWILMLGCGLDKMTFLHGVAEWCRPREYLAPAFPMPVEIYDASGSRVVSRECRPVSGYSGNFPAFEEALLAAGAIRKFRFGEGNSIAGDCALIFQTMSKILAGNPDML